MKAFLANTIVKWFKRLPFAGRFRFKCLYWAYRLTGWHIRHREWDFVLDYLPPLIKGQSVSVFDIGCSRNLFCYEIKARGYALKGCDLETPTFKYPGIFWKNDIRKEYCRMKNDFVTCISTLEHISEKQDKALFNMIASLKIGGRLLLTIPTVEFAQGHPWTGFDYKFINARLPHTAKILEYTERAGQLCLCIGKIA